LFLQAIEAMEVSDLEAANSGAAAAAPGAAAAAADAKEEVPSDLLCPITYQLLEDPVILVDSHQTYGRIDMLRLVGVYRRCRGRGRGNSALWRCAA
jgi:hypothetical protein